MKSDNPVRHFALAFVIAILIYFVAYQTIEHRRTRKGPWQVIFTNSPAGDPGIVINQPALRLTNVQILFTGASLQSRSASVMEFSQPRPVPYDLPYGKCVFMDTTFLPGTVTFQFFGHEIELLPRIMIIDHSEHPWQSGTVIALSGNQDPAR
jgi:hypothetical protein